MNLCLSKYLLVSIHYVLVQLVLVLHKAHFWAVLLKCRSLQPIPSTHRCVMPLFSVPMNMLTFE
jgi:hypothetical protein